MGVVAGGAARCPPSETELYGCKYAGDRASVRSREFGSVRSSEVQMGYSNGGSITVQLIFQTAAHCFNVSSQFCIRCQNGRGKTIHG